jgi:type II secretory pathway predicted ATPase ExeA
VKTLVLDVKDTPVEAGDNRGLHETIVATFGGQPDRSGSRLTAQASAVLAAERDERGRTPVLVIDEAHLLRYEQLEPP